MIALVGGSGFIGSWVAKILGDAGFQIKNISKEKSVTGVQNINIDIKKPIDPKVFSRVETIVHLAAVIREVGDQTFKNVNVKGAKNVCEAAKKAKIKNILYFSNIGAQNNPQFPFLYSKWQGEEIVKKSGLSYSILRPSIVFGPHDEFINKLAQVVKRSPIIPVFGDGKTRFSPIHVLDVVKIVLAIIKENLFEGKTYEIGGPQILTYDELVKTIGDKLGIKRIIIHIPIFVAHPAVYLQEIVFPNPQITIEQLKMIALDSVPKENATKKKLVLILKKFLTILTTFMAKIRTFIAIELSGEAKSEIGKIQNYFFQKDFPLAFPKKDTVHLTLVFLGNLEEEKLKTVFQATKYATKGVNSFSLQISSLGAFPNFKLPKVVWIGLLGEIDKLKNLERAIKKELEKEKLVFDEEKFIPHITIARIKTYGNKVVRRRLGEEIQRFGKLNPVKITCEEVSIFKSTPTSKGYVHELLKKISFSK